MGYEVTFHFHEEISRGEYNKEEIKTRTTKIGDSLEDVPLDVLAGKVMAQLARRNILVVDVEIYEITKKKLSFKETPDGILIKNRKFSFDEGAVVGSAEEVETQQPAAVAAAAQNPLNQVNLEQLLAALLNANPALAGQLPQQAQGQTAQTTQPQMRIAAGTNPTPNERVIRHEIFNPVDQIFLQDAKRRKLAFTVGKKYPILRERQHPNHMVGMVYTTIDDNGNRMALPDKFFSPDVGNLERGFEPEPFKPSYAANSTQDDGLSWAGVTNEYGDVGGNLRR